MSSPRSIKMKRVVAAVLFGLVLIQVIPSLAEVINGAPQSDTAVSPEPLVTITPEPSTPSETPIMAPSSSPSPQPRATVIYSEAETATPAPTYAQSQEIRIRMPAKFPVDPRATSVNISPIAIMGGETLLVCMNSDNAILQLAGANEDLLIGGNGTKSLRISGDGGAVNALLNAGRGVRLVATSKINGAIVTTRAATLTAPSIEADLCDGATNFFRSSISAMGLGMDTVKNPVLVK